MNRETTQCRTCGNQVTGATALGALCPACVLRAGRNPVAESRGAATTWAEVFPQLEVEETMKQESDLVVYRGSQKGHRHETAPRTNM